MDSVVGLLRIEGLNLPPRADSRVHGRGATGKAARKDGARSAALCRGLLSPGLTRAGHDGASPPRSGRATPSWSRARRSNHCRRMLFSSSTPLRRAPSLWRRDNVKENGSPSGDVVRRSLKNIGQANDSTRRLDLPQHHFLPNEQRGKTRDGTVLELVVNSPLWQRIHGGMSGRYPVGRSLVVPMLLAVRAFRRGSLTYQGACTRIVFRASIDALHRGPFSCRTFAQRCWFPDGLNW